MPRWSLGAITLWCVQYEEVWDAEQVVRARGFYSLEFRMNSSTVGKLVFERVETYYAKNCVLSMVRKRHDLDHSADLPARIVRS